MLTVCCLNALLVTQDATRLLQTLQHAQHSVLQFMIVTYIVKKMIDIAGSKFTLEIAQIILTRAAHSVEKQDMTTIGNLGEFSYVIDPHQLDMSILSSRTLQVMGGIL